MHVFYDMNDWLLTRKSFEPNLSLGFVPTMGNLHAGHAALCKQSKEENDITVVSIFINPTQFNDNEDFINYPRTLDNDLALLKDLGIDYCLVPEKKAMYPDNYRFQIQETEFCQRMEGKHRPGHFNGVLTVVMKWFHLVKPHRAYFGEKDYQQYVLIRDMAKTFFLDIDVVACPTIREASQLACSSRNNRLTAEQRIKAATFAKIFHQNKSCEEIKQALQDNDIHVEYLEDNQNRRFIAVLIGDIRLIDNYSLFST